MPAPGNFIYSSEYKTKLYYQWYKAGKPSSGKFALEVKPYEGKVPNQLTLQTWIKQWEIECREMDEQVKSELSKNIVQTKVEMFSEHLEQARELRIVAFNWLKENWEELTPSVAVRLRTDAMGMEQSIAGIPEAIEKMMSMTDEDLLEATLDALEDSNLESIDAISNEST